MHTFMYLLIPKLTFIVIVKQSVVCLHVLIGYEMVVFAIECFCYNETSTLESSVNNSIDKGLRYQQLSQLVDLPVDSSST